MATETQDERMAGLDIAGDALPQHDIERGFEPAGPHLDRFLISGRGVLHAVLLKGEGKLTARLNVGQYGNTDYYDDRHGVFVLPGTTSIEAARQAFALAGSTLGEGVPVVSRGRFEQTTAGLPEHYMDFEVEVEKRLDTLSGTVKILDYHGEQVAEATNVHGKLFPPEEETEKEASTELWTPEMPLPAGFTNPYDLLCRVYNHQEALKLDGILLDEKTPTGDGLIIRRNSNARYFTNRHLNPAARRIADPDLVVGATKTAGLIALREYEASHRLSPNDPNYEQLLPVFYGGSFESYERIPMGDFVVAKTVVEMKRGNILAGVVFLNSDNQIVALIQGLQGVLAPARRLKTKLSAVTKRPRPTKET